jgi:L-iditol 2-dehydrogenase
MKALVINKPGELQVKDLSTPSIAADEVLVRMRAVGICHSDYELYSGKYIIPIAYPVTPGHEWAGEIVETGNAVGGLKPGDRVVGECVIESGEKIDHFGFSIDGAYSQLFKARPEWLHKLPDAMSFQTGALVEPFTCGYYAIEANGRTNASETVVVSGGGNIGLCAAAAALGMGARVILVDPLPMRRAAAEKIGIDTTIDPAAGDALAKVLELTGGKGADLVIEASGHDSSLASVLDYARVGGRVTFVGISIGRKIAVELGKIQSKSLTIKGTIGSPGVWPAALRFLARTKLDLSPIQTHFFDLTKGVEAFEFGKNPKECIKVTLTNAA